MQDIDLVGINAGQAAAYDERLEHGNIVRTLKRPAEHPALPARRGTTQGSLQMIGANIHGWFIQVDPQFRLPLLGLVQGFTQRVAESGQDDEVLRD